MLPAVEDETDHQRQANAIGSSIGSSMPFWWRFQVFLSFSLDYEGSGPTTDEEYCCTTRRIGRI